MWTRAELKAKAMINLKKYYWAAFLVSLIFSIVSTNGSGFQNVMGSSNSPAQSEMVLPEPMEGMDGVLSGDVVNNVGGILDSMPISGSFSGMKWSGLILGLFTGIVIIAVIVGLILTVFVAPVVEVGKNRFYLESRLAGQSAGAGRVMWGFSHNYLNIVLTRFLQNLFVAIGTICCVIPGIYLTYAFRMVPYILAENPDMKPMEVLRLSMQMMDGQKMDTFVLDVSLLGWAILGVLACCIGTIFVQPYFDAINAELYAVLRRPYSGNLRGFGYPETDFCGEMAGNSMGYNSGCTAGYTTGNTTGNTPEYTPEYTTENTTGQSAAEPFSTPVPGEAGMVNRTEGGPGSGYYLNGEFHPYSEEDNNN